MRPLPGTRRFNKPVLGSQLDRGHPLSDGLIAAWIFNEGGGGWACDLVSGILLKSVGTTWDGSPDGTALKTTTTSQFSVTTDLSGTARNLPQPAAFSVAMGATPNGAQGSFARMAEMWFANNWYLGCNSGGNAYQFVVTAGPTGTVGAVINGTVTSNSPTALCGTFQPNATGPNGVATLYVNRATPVSQAFVNPTPSSSALPIYVSTSNTATGTNGFVGKYSYLYYYNRALGKDETFWLADDPYAIVQPHGIRKFFSASGTTNKKVPWHLLTRRGI